MTTFFTILFIIIGLNAILMFFSLKGTNRKHKKSSTVSKTAITDINTIDLIAPEYKEAV